MTTRADELLQNLASLPLEKQAAVIDAYREKRKQEEFIKFWTPQPQQLPHFKLLSQKPKEFGILGGNRSGKTEEGAAIVVAAALGKDYFRGEPAWEWVKFLPFKEPPLNIWVVGLDFNVLWDVIWGEKFLRGRTHPGFVPLNELAKKPSESEPVLYFKNGTIITGKSADSGREKFQSASVDIVWMDEEAEVEVADECYQRTADCAGSLLYTLTPLTDIASGVRTPWIHDKYNEFRGGTKDIIFVNLNVLENPHVPEQEKTRLIEKWRGHPEERARLYGDFIQRSGLVYNLWNKDVHMVKPISLPRDWATAVIIDPAPSGPTAALKFRVSPNGDYYFVNEYKQANLTVADHAKNILIRMAGDPVDIWGIDPKGGNQRQAENHKTIAQLYRENGIPVRLLDLPEDYGMEASRQYIQATTEPTSRQPKAYFFNDLKLFEDEITHYVWAFFGKGELRGLSKEKPLKRNDHLMNCFQYACAMRLRGNRNAQRHLSQEERVRATATNSYT